MCGLAGFTAPDATAPAVLEAMSAALVHRGPDGTGHHIDSRLAVGHRRLAVVDPAGGAQPRVDAEHGDVLAFNGEIYGYRRLADDLRSRGVALCDASDTEVLFQLLRRDGVRATLRRIDGMFAFAFRDGRSGALTLARDRFGEKPLFYAEAAGTLIFGSEIKSLRRHPLLRGETLQPDQVDRFLAFEYLPAPLTGYGRIRKLPPGHLLTYLDGRAVVERWWVPQVAEAGTAPVDPEQAVERLGSLLTDAVRERLIADVPVGVFLSGGLDSSLIAAITGRLSGGLTAYTVRMPDASHDETPYAQAVAGHCGLRHEIIDLGPADLLAAFDAVTGQLDELMADSSLLPTWAVCRAARRSVTVALGGDGADELFAGYPNHKAQQLAEVMARLPPALGRGMRAVLNLLPPSSGYMSLGFRLAQLSQGFGQPTAHQSFLWMSPFPPDQRPLLWRDAVRPDADIFAEIDALLSGAPKTAVERLLHLMTVTYLPEHILTKVDRASMYTALEVRAPYLARDFAEAAMALPTAAKLHRLSGKVLLKRLALRHLPRAVVERPKHGFALPLAEMLRGPLRDRVADVILDPTNPVSDWFDRARLDRILAAHAAGQADFRKQIWSLFILFLVAARPA